MRFTQALDGLCEDRTLCAFPNKPLAQGANQRMRILRRKSQVKKAPGVAFNTVRGARAQSLQVDDAIELGSR